MFTAGDVYIGNYKFKTDTGYSEKKQKIEILSVADDNTFTIKFYYNWNNVTGEYLNDAMGKGSINPIDKTFKITEKLDDKPNEFDITVINGRLKHIVIFIILPESLLTGPEE